MFQEVLSVAVGPRSDEEVYTVHQIECLMDRVEKTLGCRKVIRTASAYLIQNFIVHINQCF